MPDSPAPLLNALRARTSALQTFRARGSIDQYGREGRVRGNIELVVRQPERFYVAVSAMNSNPLRTMVSDGTQFLLLAGSQYVHGPARPCVAARMLGLSLDARDAVAILSGGTPLLSERVSGPTWQDGAYVLEVAGDAGARQRIEFELPAEERDAAVAQQHPRLRRVVLFDARGQRGEVTYLNWRTLGGVSFPERVRLVMPRDQVDTQLRFDEVQPNYTPQPDPLDPGGTPRDPFQLPRPEGAEDLAIDC